MNLLNDVEEYQQTLNELKQFPLLETLKKSYARFNEKQKNAYERSGLAIDCHAGCSWCCSIKVEVKAHEMLLVADHLKTHPNRKKIIEAAKENSKIIRKLTPREHEQTNIKCPCLIDGKCSVYEVRPFNCRAFHSTDKSDCISAYNNPKGLIFSTMISLVDQVSTDHALAYEGALLDQGYDVEPSYDFNTALVSAVADLAGSQKRYKKGKTTFKKTVKII